jgi:hypothetical protein
MAAICYVRGASSRRRLIRAAKRPRAIEDRRRPFAPDVPTGVQHSWRDSSRMPLPGSRARCGTRSHGVCGKVPGGSWRDYQDCAPRRRASQASLMGQPAGRRSWRTSRAEGPRRSSRGVSRGSCRRPRALGGGPLPGLQRVVRRLTGIHRLATGSPPRRIEPSRLRANPSRDWCSCRHTPRS